MTGSPELQAAFDILLPKKQQRYKIKRLADNLYYCKDGQWRSDVASFFTAAQCGTLLAEFPNGMKEGFYRMIPGKS